jgi:hypothetical protein
MHVESRFWNQQGISKGISQGISTGGEEDPCCNIWPVSPDSESRTFPPKKTGTSRTMFHQNPEL